ncbi:unnamed protein product [Eruca vesicaria subsp. sativa]|uniref:DUF4378 domain-containing protein n=1 Tax=Eruca vesicaria subsp. sativa TaxID=29727 RepID=A0ABC8IZ34_ERUVS|nr:unnamed protein product [Eruca vesicaria subsp. sativa]
MASLISSSDHRLPVSKKRLKPLILRDYLLDDLSSCSSNGFKSFPRHQTTTADIKRRFTCGLAFSHAVQKASMALLSAVKLLPSPSPSVKPPSSLKKRLFSISFSRNLWKKLNNVDGEMEDRKQEIQRCRSFGDFLKESLDDQPSDEDTLSKAAGGGESASFGSELFTNSELTQSLSETSSKNGAVEDVTEETRYGVVVMMSGDCVGSHVSEGSSSVNDNREECVNEEKEHLSPISILEYPFEDDAITLPNSHQKETEEKNLMRKIRRFESVVRLEPVDLMKRIEEYIKIQDCNSHMVETEEDQSENRASRLFALVKSRLIEEPSHLLESRKVDSLLLDFFKDEGHNETGDDDKLVKIVEEWLLKRQDDECMFMSWEVREKREIYVKEMTWGCINGEERDYVVEELGNSFVTDLIDELMLDISL